METKWPWGCKFDKSDTTINVYYKEDGTMDRTRLTSEEDGALNLFWEAMFSVFWFDEPFVCENGDEYLDTDDPNFIAARKVNPSLMDMAKYNAAKSGFEGTGESLYGLLWNSAILIVIVTLLIQYLYFVYEHV